uniref:Uncharacterized protein n=1 Tax=Rhizophora mucronata TaxID=61149 RepID=A0A2P2NXF1_RHIMU
MELLTRSHYNQEINIINPIGNCWRRSTRNNPQ